ncbi:MAG: Mur ligase family protein, partial [Acidimicrobiales bacterium]|nr:Mur ligase family protein [Acidimicrobiales bacterium]
MTGRPIPLAALLDAAGLPAAVPAGSGHDPRVVVTGVRHDSRAVRPGDLFCCVPGGTTDGHDHAPAAVAAGAVALLVERPLRIAVPQVVVPSARSAMAAVATAYWERPSDRLDVVGVTGTNGKTTVATVLAHVLSATGRPTTVIGTLTGARTTPEATDLQELLAGALTAGDRAVSMEVSSHALDQHRVDGTRFAATLFTNL